MSDSNKTVATVEENVATVAQATETPKCKECGTECPDGTDDGKCLPCFDKAKTSTAEETAVKDEEAQEEAPQDSGKGLPADEKKMLTSAVNAIRKGRAELLLSYVLAGYWCLAFVVAQTARKIAQERNGQAESRPYPRGGRATGS